MLPRRQRATTRDVLRVQRGSTTTHKDHFSIRKVDTQFPAVFSIVVSKKVCATAVGRNKLKRKIRNALLKITLPQTGVYVIYTKRGAQILTQPEIIKEVQELFT